MRPNPIAPWELRIGNLRVYHDIEEAPEPVVLVQAQEGDRSTLALFSRALKAFQSFLAALTSHNP